MALGAQPSGRHTSHCSFLIYGTGIRSAPNPCRCNTNPVLIYGKPPFAEKTFRQPNRWRYDAAPVFSGIAILRRRRTTMKTGAFLIGALSILLGTATAQAQQRRPGQVRGLAAQNTAERPQENPSEQEQRRTPPPPPPVEKSSVTHHSARVGGEEINYTATAATYVIKADDGTPKATFFFVAYTKDGVADVSKRPLSFVYNGGPGSASLFTHMGMGPKRVVLTPDGHGMPAPYSIEDNQDSFLDATDLVFIDAVSTGYSRPAPGQNPSQFYGIREDANWFSDFIYQYITRNERWDSPKYLIGESYGTTRSAELSGVLQDRHQIYLNGIVLVSTVAFASWGADDRSEFYLPTYTMTAWYHKLLPADLESE